MTVPLAKEIHDTLLPFVGTVEIQPNVGFTGTHAHDFTALLERAGWEPKTNEPYCCFTATQAIVETFKSKGVPLPPQIIRAGSTSELARHAQGLGKLSASPATGCIALMKGGDTGHHHTEVVIAVNDDGTTTNIGANTTNPENEAVQGVWIKKRNIKDFDFVIW